VGECENEHSHSQVNSHFGNWNPNGFSNLQIVGNRPDFKVADPIPLRAGGV
jgi:hypothetical protein